MQKWPLILWARYVFAAGTALGLILFVPVEWFPLQAGKLAIFALCLCLAALFFVLGQGAGGVYGRRGVWSAFAVGLLPLSYLVSYAFSTDKTVGLLGYALESDTVWFVLLCSIAFLFSSFLFRRYVSLAILLHAVWGMVCAAAIFQLCVIVLHPYLGSTLFSDSSLNLIGKWNDLGLLAALGLVFSMMRLGLGGLSRRGTALVLLSVAVFAAVAVLANFSLVWMILLAFFSVLGVWSYLTSRFAYASRGDMIRNLPWVPCAGAVVCIAMLLWGALFQTTLARVLPVSAFEVRPGFSSTLDIVRNSHGESVTRFMFGTGPGTFARDWLLYKPAQVNQTQFWNTDFTVGFSVLSNALCTVGVLGALMWLVPLGLLFTGVLRLIRMHDSVHNERVAALAAAAGAMVLWAGAIFYVPSQNLLVLMFVLSGAAFGFCMRGEPAATDNASSPVRMRRMLFFALLAACICAAAVITWVAARRFVSQAYVTQALAALQQGNTAQASASALRALNTEPTASAYQAVLLSGAAHLRTLANASSAPDPQTQKAFTDEVQALIPYGQAAVAAYPSDYRTYVAFAKVYDILTVGGVSGAFAQSLKLYTEAAEHNPTSPEIPFAIAQLESVAGTTQGVNAALERALTLKPDYTDAMLFIVQLEVAKKNIRGAIAAAEAAVKTAPGVASIWFQLGLLYYYDNDMRRAKESLEKALVLQPDYANAKYFLGLAYAQLGQRAEAIQQFKDLESTNPDNGEVKIIRTNLEAGKAPLDGIQAQGGGAPVRQ